MSTFLSVLAGENDIRVSGHVPNRNKNRLGIRPHIIKTMSSKDVELLGRSFFSRMARKAKNATKQVAHIAITPARAITHAALSVARVPVNLVTLPFQHDSGGANVDTSSAMTTTAPAPIDSVAAPTAAAATLPPLVTPSGVIVASPAAPGVPYPTTEDVNAANPDYDESADDSMDSEDDSDSSDDDSSDGAMSEETLGSVASFVRNSTHNVLQASRKGIGAVKDAQGGLQSFMDIFSSPPAPGAPASQGRSTNWLLVGGIGLGVLATTVIVVKKMSRRRR